VEGYFVIRAEDWNNLTETLTRNLPLVCGGDEVPPWRHPWHMVTRWRTEAEAWAVQINPGSVNGEEVEIDLLAEVAPPDTLARLGEPKPGESVRAYLTESPEVPVRAFRAIGKGSAATGAMQTPTGGVTTTHEPVPPFFLALGVKEAKPVTFQDPNTGVTSLSGLVSTEEDLEPYRLLRACDVALFKDRFGTATNWQQGAGVDGTFMQFDVGYSIPPGGVRPFGYVKLDSQYSPPVPVDPMAKPLGGYADATNDTLKIGTLYFLSPYDADLDEPVNETWTPYVAHDLFWNLMHATNRLGTVADTSLSLPLPLAGGIAQPLVNNIVATLNDEADKVAEFLANHELAGRFWSV
jgi:hypothetical protein